MLAKIKSLVVLFMGISLMSIGIALAKLAQLGTSPISSIPNVMSYIMPLSIGNLTIIFMILMIVLQMILLREVNLSIMLQIVPGVIFGWLIDVFVVGFTRLGLPAFMDHYFEQLVFTLMGMLVLSFGVFLEVNSRSILMPGEGLVVALTLRTKQPFGKLKMFTDLTMVAVALIISLLYFQGLVGIREGTLITALFTGRLVALYEPLIPWVDRLTTK
ncbi:YczE/YyaS/YitT family protein [Enterococcus pseudoavium]|uniref:YczE/YyaS/YitT family protein n=1 Tax=Enterococcus pseudoavium TaxID=44007 RepID=UPI003F95E545